MSELPRLLKCKSLINNKIKIGTSTEPWGTPILKFLMSENAFDTEIVWHLSLKQDENQLNDLYENLLFCNFNIEADRD